MNRGEAIALAKINWKRQAADYYPTPFKATWGLVDWMIEAGLVPETKEERSRFKVLEPCCGEGYISRVLDEEYGLEVTSHDLLDHGYGEGGIDYLAKKELSANRYEFDAVITNPPFSRSMEIIYRAMKDAPIVAMLLPTEYWHAGIRANFFMSRPPRAILALTWRLAFLKEQRGPSPLGTHCWTIWDQRKPQKTEYLLLKRPK